MTKILTDEAVIMAALDAGFMLSTRHGQESNRLMPVSDAKTLIAFAKAISSNALEAAAKECEAPMDAIRLQVGEISRQSATDCRAVLNGRAAAIRQIAKELK